MKIIETPWHLLGKFIGLGFGIPFFFSRINLVILWGKCSYFIQWNFMDSCQFSTFNKSKA
ncbi:hypothetical protein HMPREF9129_0872 [Peptoniphilus indolicus ATCC 29427]|uniref:Uncharacterized protein n=1 Tax=Peptoniphilus indolicus ATCC 29427 TaxID=997350 RepID=G4D380_9FIRM|nr:hypothetical protein HMPREF9129_0872 [Peptoniphilus indolicus ATCC 29427]